MNLKLNKLQNVVKKVMKEEKIVSLLKEDVKKVVGPTILLEDRNIDSICDDVMDYADIVEYSGNSLHKWSPNVLIKLLEHSSPRVRRFAARFAPKDRLSVVLSDKSSLVRCEVAKRVSLHELKTMCKRFPNDDAISYILEKRSRDDSDGFDMYGDRKLGDVTHISDSQELSDSWYDLVARKLVQEYGISSNPNWIPLAVKQYVDSNNATFGYEIDAGKLLDCVNEIFHDHDERVLANDSLKETIDYLNRVSLEEETVCAVDEDVDIVQEFLDSNKNSANYIEEATKFFSISEKNIPKSMSRKFLMLEGRALGIVSIPACGYLPHNFGFRSIDEQAIQMFVDDWNQKAQMQEIAVELDWSPDQEDERKFNFITSLR